ncbi:MAG: hypothetical protein UT58_C0005G0011 [Microgenomates group bacterium GW2011_GWC1_39_7b]|uniref:Pilus assembly protein, PilO n=3 Tax=Candidatus Woeseibacteriota TaxID=1752722 RepID=A0A0G0LVU8_9BACT|nr:MAG: hypothetical protein UT17_C0003G0138 [Candidatus Woesebacteria bacterium GW2011_GWB1_39_10]KKR26835.1 MAG: hypothetical protein UT58_C0005G0011 [Microgenomates group bacterium GW2011_GWC1_39_7b]KKR73248.1 MAG: hypothetical protein UU16_C0026G0006 [Candidatus Woesebacteria bacterium GW2011_GWA2_40_7]KKS91075.1 MAG: hypothetical protein UV66_C0001G0432 [Candidatus Woesebacteria bacterium GW2011_GWA1_43_12]
MALGWRGSYLRYREYFLNIMSLYKKRAEVRAFLEIILSLVTITIFLTFALKPTVLTIISLVQQIQEKKTTVAALDQKIKNLKTAVAVLAQNEAAAGDVDFAISSQANFDAVSKQIQGLAIKDSVTILGLSIGQTILVGVDASVKKSSDYKPIPGNPGEMPISLSIKGTYFDILSFVKDFGNLRIAIKIDSLGINSSQTDSGQVIVAVVAGRVPYLKN